MAVENERKFLLRGDGWRADIQSSMRITQAYLSTDPERVVRIRLSEDLTRGQARGYLTIKGQRRGQLRSEYEYPIPPDEAQEMLTNLCLAPSIEKTRHLLARGPGEWIVDEFATQNAGLVLAEIEFDTATPDPTQELVLPDWIGEEVTEDDRYANAYLQLHPYSTWSTSQNRAL
jgi:adenylate cyclase